MPCIQKKGCCTLLISSALLSFRSVKKTAGKSSAEASCTITSAEAKGASSSNLEGTIDRDSAVSLVAGAVPKLNPYIIRRLLVKPLPFSHCKDASTSAYNPFSVGFPSDKP